MRYDRRIFLEGVEVEVGVGVDQVGSSDYGTILTVVHRCI